MTFNTYSNANSLANGQKACGGEWRVLPMTGDGAEGQTRLMHGCRQATAGNAATTPDGMPASETKDCPQFIATIFTGHASDEVRHARQERAIRYGTHPWRMHEPSPGTHGDSVGADGYAVGVCHGIVEAETPLINQGLPLVCANKSGSGKGNESATNSGDAAWMPLQGLHVAKRAGARPAYFMGPEASSSMSHWQPPPGRHKHGEVCNISPSPPPKLICPHTECLGNGLGRGVGAKEIRKMKNNQKNKKTGQSEAAETKNINNQLEAEVNETASQEPKTKTTASPSTEKESSGKKEPSASLKVEDYPNDKWGQAKLRKLANQGDAQAQYWLAKFLLANSPKTKKPRVEAIDWLKKAAYRTPGNEDARVLLSRLYDIGDENLPQDPVLVYARKRIEATFIPAEAAAFTDPVFWRRKIKRMLPPSVEKELRKRFQGIGRLVDASVEKVKDLIEAHCPAPRDGLAPWVLVDEVIAEMKGLEEGCVEEDEEPEYVHLSAEQARKLAARLMKEKGGNGADAAEGLNPLRMDGEGALSFAEDEMGVLEAFLREEAPELLKLREGQEQRPLVFIVDPESTEAEETSVTPDTEAR